MANVIRISDGQTHVVNTPVNANYIIENGTLEVKSGGKITGSGSEQATVVVKRGELVVSGGQISSEDVNRSPFFVAVKANAGGSIRITDGLIQPVSSGTMGVPSVTLEGGTLIVSGGAVVGSHGGTSSGDGVQVNRGTVKVSGGTIAGGNGNTGSGTGLRMNDGTLELSGGTIHGGNESTVGGDGLHAQKSKLVLTGGAIIAGKGRTAAGSGLQFGASEVTFNGTSLDGSASFSDCRGTVSRIGTFFRFAIGGGDLTLDGNEIMGKSAFSFRGPGKLTAKSGTIRSAAMELVDDTTIQLTGTTFQETLRITQAQVSPNARVNIGGGSFNGLRIDTMAAGLSVSITGGSLKGALAQERGFSEVVGSGLAITEGKLKGTLKDGQAIEMPVTVGDFGKVVLRNG